MLLFSDKVDRMNKSSVVASTIATCFVVLFVASSCVTSQNEIFKLSTGQVFVCQRYTQSKCGMRLIKCGPNSDFDFECVRDVHYVGSSSSLKETTEEQDAEAYGESPVTAIDACESPAGEEDSAAKHPAPLRSLPSKDKIK
jgi:hypothetical protein